MARGKSNGKGNGKSRRSKAENMTGAKANEVEVTTASQLELPDIEIAEDDWHIHFRSFKSATDLMAKAKNAYDAACKAAKKVSPHLLAALKLHKKFEGMDHVELSNFLQEHRIALQHLGSPIQLSLHNTLMGDANDAAYARGKDDGLNGRTCKSPYPEGSSLAESYLTGWRNGTGSNLGLSEEETQAAIAGSPAGETAGLPN